MNDKKGWSILLCLFWVLSQENNPGDVLAFINGLKKIVKTIIREVVAQWFVLPYTEHSTQ